MAKRVDWNRYLGTWYEAARLPVWFERGLNQVKAVYSMLPSGDIRIENSGYNADDGSLKMIEGKARIDADHPENTLLVTFFPTQPPAPYVVLDVKSTYQAAIVGSPSKQFLWLLVRHKGRRVSKSLWSWFILRAKAYGYSIDTLKQLEMT